MSFGIMRGWFNCNVLCRQVFLSRQVHLWSHHKKLPLASHRRKVDASQRFLSSKKQDFHSHNVNEMLPRLVWNDHSVIVRNMSTRKKVTPQSQKAAKPYSRQEFREVVFQPPPGDYKTVFKSTAVKNSLMSSKLAMIAFGFLFFVGVGLSTKELVELGLKVSGFQSMIDDYQFWIGCVSLQLAAGVVISIIMLRYYHVSEILVHKNKISACIRYLDQFGYKRNHYEDLPFWPQKMRKGRTYCKFKFSRGFPKRYKIANEDLKYISDKGILPKFLGKIPRT